jgi:pyruvate dehydrogenase E2 component (dihydrolipoamide acetyltransferase)
MRPATLSPMRRAVGRRMAASKREAPHFYVNCDLELDAALAHIGRLADAEGERVTLTALLLRATLVSLEAHPALNAVWEDGELMQPDEVAVGVAIALPDGLVAPAVFARDAAGLVGAARALNDLVARARGGKLRGRELTEATFTLSNLGMFEVTSFIPIVTPPQTAILGVGKSRRVPRLQEDDVAPHTVVTVTVSADHRAVDGADVARFLGTLKSAVEHPDELGG